MQDNASNATSRTDQSPSPARSSERPRSSRYELENWKLGNDSRLEDRRPKKKMRSIEDAAKESSRGLPATGSPQHQHNIESSLLHRLPVDLFLELIEYLREDTVTVLVMQLVARDFYALFKPPWIIDLRERDLFKTALRRDDGLWFGKWERFKGLQLLEKAVCSACNTRHVKKCFSQDELVKDPEDRICVPAQETIRIRTGQKATLNDIYDLKLSFLAARSHGHFSTAYASISHITGPLDLKAPPFLESIIGLEFSSRQLHLTYHFHLLSIPKGTPVCRDILSGSLSAIQQYLCPAAKISSISDLQHERINAMSMSRRSSRPLSNNYNKLTIRNCPCSKDSSKNNGEKCHFDYASHRRASEVQESLEEVILTVSKLHQDPLEDAEPTWADKFLWRQIAHQNALNAKSGKQIRTRLYRTKKKVEWDWYDASRIGIPGI